MGRRANHRHQMVISPCPPTPPPQPPPQHTNNHINNNAHDPDGSYQGELDWNEALLALYLPAQLKVLCSHTIAFCQRQKASWALHE